MKKIYLSGIAIAFALAVLFTGCKKEDTTTDTGTSDMTFSLQSDNTTTAVSSVGTSNGTQAVLATTTTTASVAWTTATANISKFKFNATKSGVAYEVISSGLVNVDLLATLPSTINVSIINGTYTNVQLKVLLAKSTTTTLPFVLKGTYTTRSGSTVPIEFDFNDDAEIIATANDLNIDGKNNLLAKLSLHLNQLLANVTASEIDATTRTLINGVSTIQITSAINPTVYNKIKTDLMLSGGSAVTTKAK